MKSLITYESENHIGKLSATEAIEKVNFFLTNCAETTDWQTSQLCLDMRDERTKELRNIRWLLRKRFGFFPTVSKGHPIDGETFKTYI